MPYADSEKRRQAVRASKQRHRKRYLLARRQAYAATHPLTNYPRKDETHAEKEARVARIKQQRHEYEQSPKRRQRKRARDACRKYNRKSYYKRVHNLTLAELRKCWRKQNGRCKICRQRIYARKARNSRQALQVDHDHETGEIRGLLCRQCNLGLGAFNDRPRLLKRAIAYVQNHYRRQQKKRKLRH